MPMPGAAAAATRSPSPPGAGGDDLAKILDTIKDEIATAVRSYDKTVDTRFRALEQEVADLRAAQQRIKGSDSDQPAGFTNIKIDSVDPTTKADKAERKPGNDLAKVASVKPEQLDTGDQYELGGSTWDMCILVGHPCLGTPVSIMAVLAYSLNFFLQLGFAMLVLNSLVAGNDIADPAKLDSLLHFRLGTAHNVQYADLVSQRSLAEQICMEDFKLHHGATQMDLQGELKAYSTISWGASQGELLAIMAMFLWVATIFNEISKTLQFARAVFALPRTPKTCVTLLEDGEVKSDEDAEMYQDSVEVRLASMSHRRLVGVLAGIILPRFGLAIFVAIAGIRYLSVTHVLGDLILNAIALAFIIDCDELLFSIFMPWRIVALQANLEPLRVKYKFKSWPWVAPIVKAVLMLVLLLVIWVVLLAPFHGRLKMANMIMCSGNTDFVYSVNIATGMVHVSKSRQWQSGGGFNYIEQRVLEAVQATPESPYEVEDGSGWTIHDDLRGVLNSNQEYYNIEPRAPKLDEAVFTSAGFRKVADMPTWSAEIAAQGLPCNNLGAGDSESAALQKLSETVGMNVNSCEEVPWQLCSNMNMSELRALCPVRCMCHQTTDNGAFTGFFGHPKWGCPAQCASQRAVNSEIYPGISTCTDKAPKEYIFEAAETCGNTDLATTGDKNKDYCHTHFWATGCSNAFDDTDWSAELMCCSCGGGLALADSITTTACYNNLQDDCRMITAPALFWLLYVRGLVEFLESRQGFRDMVENNMKNPELNIPNTSQSTLLEHIMHPDGLEQMLLSKDWQFMPGFDHPRDLGGCDFLTSWEFKLLLNIDLCDGDREGFASIQMLCPHSCKCGPTSDLSQCPMACIVGGSSSSPSSSPAPSVTPAPAPAPVGDTPTMPPTPSTNAPTMPPVPGAATTTVGPGPPAQTTTDAPVAIDPVTGLPMPR